jgi:transporter family-2 protein
LNPVFLVLCALAAGCGLSLQAGVNSELRTATGSGVWAAFASFIVGAVALFFFTLPVRQHWPTVALLKAAPWWVWSGGVIGAAYVLSTILIAPRLGATAFFSMVIAGQLAASLFLDRFGLLGFAAQRITPLRIVGLLLVMAGAYCVRGF